MPYFDFAAGHGEGLDSDSSHFFGQGQDIEVESDSDLDGFVAGDESVTYESDQDDPLNSDDESVQDNIDPPPYDGPRINDAIPVRSEVGNMNMTLTWIDGDFGRDSDNESDLVIGSTQRSNSDNESNNESDIVLGSTQRSSSAKIIQISDSSDSDDNPSSGSSRASQRIVFSDEDED
jgi:hypothetical protein